LDNYASSPVCSPARPMRQRRCGSPYTRRYAASNSCQRASRSGSGPSAGSWWTNCPNACWHRSAYSRENSRQVCHTSSICLLNMSSGCPSSARRPRSAKLQHSVVEPACRHSALTQQAAPHAAEIIVSQHLQRVQLRVAERHRGPHAQRARVGLDCHSVPVLPLLTAWCSPGAAVNHPVIARNGLRAGGRLLYIWTERCACASCLIQCPDPCVRQGQGTTQRNACLARQSSSRTAGPTESPPSQTAAPRAEN